MKKTLRRGLASATIVIALCLAGTSARTAGTEASGSEPAGGGTGLVIIGPDATPPLPPSFQDAPMLAPLVESGKLPPVAERLPKTPLVVDLKGRGPGDRPLWRGFAQPREQGARPSPHHRQHLHAARRL